MRALLSREHALQDVKSLASGFDLTFGRSVRVVQQPASLCLEFPQVRDQFVKFCPVRYCSALTRSERMMEDEFVRIAALQFERQLLFEVVAGAEMVDVGSHRIAEASQEDWAQITCDVLLPFGICGTTVGINSDT